MNGFGYALFGVPPRDLETTWRDEVEVTMTGESPLLGRSAPVQTVAAITVSYYFCINIHFSVND